MAIFDSSLQFTGKVRLNLSKFTGFEGRMETTVFLRLFVRYFVVRYVF